MKFLTALSVLAIATTLADNVDSQRFLQLINNLRQSVGAGPVCYNQKLNNAAKGHSDDMSSHQQMQHPGSDGSEPWERVKREGFSWGSVAENVAWDSAGFNADSLFEIWKNSPGHYRNMIGGEYKFIGLSTINGYSTLDLAGSDNESCSNGSADSAQPATKRGSSHGRRRFKRITTWRRPDGSTYQTTEIIWK